MTYEEAIRLAEKGDEQGYHFLYESTYREKYYLALKLMKNEQEAEAVVLMAYLRALKSLDDLDNPDNFPKWFDLILAITVKQELQKKNPQQFRVVRSDEVRPEYGEVDDKWLSLPRISREEAGSPCSREEMQKRVEVITGLLSVEQLMSFLLFWLEEIDIPDIAAALECPEWMIRMWLADAYCRLELYFGE